VTGLQALITRRPRAAFSDAVLADGALVHAQLAIRVLGRDVAGYAATPGTGVAR
jgi:hypothetical protein